MIQDYAIMQQQQEIAQYQQLLQPPPTLPFLLNRQIAYSPQYQFGVPGGQWENQLLFRNRAMTAAVAAGLTAASVGVSWPLLGPTWRLGVGMARAFGATSATRLAGLARFAGGFAISGLALAPLTEVVSRAVSRQEYFADINADIGAFEERFTRGVGYGRTHREALAQSLMTEMREQPSFFRPEDQMKIHKYGLSTGLLKGRTIDEYKRNFNTLKDTVKEIITVLNTTIEGGLGVMQELQRSGFRTPQAIRQQVMQAKAWGGWTGIGAQNMMLIGAAGAQAAYGTGWAPAVAANMYQAGATVLGSLAYTNPMLSGMIANVGGIAEAGGMLGSAMMNVLRSGKGLQAMTYAMDPATKHLDMGRFSRLLRGEATALEIVSGSQRYGAFGPGGGAANRVLAARDTLRVLNQMSPEQQMLAVRGIYSAWARQYAGLGISREAMAYRFAQEYSMTPEQAEFMQNVITAPSLGFENMQAARRAQEMSVRLSLIPPTHRAGATMLMTAGRVIGMTFENIGQAVLTGVKDVYSGLSKFGRWMWYRPTVSMDRETIMKAYGPAAMTENMLNLISADKAAKDSPSRVTPASDEMMKQVLGADPRSFISQQGLTSIHGTSALTLLFAKTASYAFSDMETIKDDFVTSRLKIGKLTKDQQLSVFTRLTEEARQYKRTYDFGAETYAEYQRKASMGDNEAKNALENINSLYFKAFKQVVYEQKSPREALLRYAAQENSKEFAAALSLFPFDVKVPTMPAVRVSKEKYREAMETLSTTSSSVLKLAGSVAATGDIYGARHVMEMPAYGDILPSLKEKRIETLVELQGLPEQEAAVRLARMGIDPTEVKNYLETRKQGAFNQALTTITRYKTAEAEQALTARLDVLEEQYGREKAFDRAMIERLLRGQREGVDVRKVRSMFPEMDLKDLSFDGLRKTVAGIMMNVSLMEKGPAARMKDDILTWTNNALLIDSLRKNKSDEQIKEDKELSEKLKDLESKQKEIAEKYSGGTGFMALAQLLAGDKSSMVAAQPTMPMVNNFWNNRWFAGVT